MENNNQNKDALTRQMIQDYIAHTGAVLIIWIASIVVGFAVITFFYYLGKSLYHLIK